MTARRLPSGAANDAGSAPLNCTHSVCADAVSRNGWWHVTYWRRRFVRRRAVERTLRRVVVQRGATHKQLASDVQSSRRQRQVQFGAHAVPAVGQHNKRRRQRLARQNFHNADKAGGKRGWLAGWRTTARRATDHKIIDVDGGSSPSKIRRKIGSRALLSSVS